MLAGLRPLDMLRFTLRPLTLALAVGSLPMVARAEEPSSDEQAMKASGEQAGPDEDPGLAGTALVAPVPSGWAPSFVARAAERASLVFAGPAVDPGLSANEAALASGDSPDEEEGVGPARAASEGDFAIPDLSVLVAEPVRGVANSGFGWRDDPIRHYRRFHRGTDFRAPHGTPVYAAAGGEVIFAGRRGGYGRSIDIRHADGLLTRYGHLSRIEIARGQRVEADTLIGLVGATGRATGPHLHFEVRIFGRAVDPNQAVRVGELQRTAAPDVARIAALALRAEVQESTVSALDPPRPGSRTYERHGRKHERSHHRRPRIS